MMGSARAADGSAPPAELKAPPRPSSDPRQLAAGLALSRARSRGSDASGRTQASVGVPTRGSAGSGGTGGTGAPARGRGASAGPW
jgi:hypothetical protein